MGVQITGRLYMDDHRAIEFKAHWGRGCENVVVGCVLFLPLGERMYVRSVRYPRDEEDGESWDRTRGGEWN